MRTPALIWDSREFGLHGHLAKADVEVQLFLDGKWTAVVETGPHKLRNVVCSSGSA